MSTITFGDALGLVEGNEVLTSGVIEFFTIPVDGEPEALTKLRATNAVEIAQKTKAQFALELKAFLFAIYQPQALKIAGAILEELRAMEIAPATSEAAPVVNQVQQPLEVKVNFPTSIDDMRVSELLLYIATNPGEATEGIEVLKSKSVVRKASQKTLKFAIRAEQGGLDALLTNEYLTHLAQEATSVLPKFKGKRPVTLEIAIGMDSRSLIHPLTGETIKGVEPTFGQYDFAELSEERHLAVIWARTTNHRAFPKPVDLFTHIPELFAEQWSGRWALILEEYQDAKLSGDSSVEGLSRYYNKEAEFKNLADEINQIIGNVRGAAFPGDTSYRTGGVAKTEAEWKKIVLENVSFPEISISGSMSKVFPSEVYPGGSISGSASAVFRNTIMLDNLYASGSASLSGNIIFPKGSQLICKGSVTDNTTPQYKTWKQIAELMQLA